MLSLRQSIKDLDDAAVAHQAAAKAFAAALETSAAHVVEVNRQEAEEFREQVLHLAGRVSHSLAATELETARSTFRGELRDYSEKARAHVKKLREELDAAASAMQTFAQGVDISTGDHDTVLRREFRQLEQAATGDDLLTIRCAIHDTVQHVRDSYEGLKQAQAVVIAQLRDEVRVLQETMEQTNRKSTPPAGLLSRREWDDTVDALLLRRTEFAVVFATVPDVDELRKRYPREKVDTAVSEMVANLAALAREGYPRAALTAYNANLLGAITAAAPPVHTWQHTLSTSHVFQWEGLPRTLRIATNLIVVAIQPGESPESFLHRLSKAAQTLTNTASLL